ncbi:DeoR/GlpR family DNA-binding transcription regulator [Pseudohalocynthiibacter sp. F2068]|jgi:DeoR family transcriptional regulator, glycerol-3-phosphate regulon repressor|uniref:DeoR/GlpR family DNA-binding transcription regulator n=1 Tax=Pseudohalocynthiibacter sp. F2068 TaxID=2926418 RepID=UPI001FF15381|nr:DeoR/GlpR family DNA-binding transcription regulator [Pseudohalocynthiibacter sp. F2068]MCK0102740.1 DeoR/GlpR family DNA-binding transcription regulator [Pseudohalocynthiibacter sp. F2068]
MSSKKSSRREAITAFVLEQGAVTVGSLAERFDVSMQTIRRDVDALCEGDMLHRVHGRIELSEEFLNTPFDQRAGTNLLGKRAIGETAAGLIPDGATVFISIGSTPLSVAQSLRRRKGLTIITNNLSAAMVLSEEVSNRIILPGGELRLPDRDILGNEVLDFFGRFRAEFAVFGAAGIADDGGLLEFHTTEVRATQKIRANAQKSLLVVDWSKFGRQAPALGDNIAEIDTIIIDRHPGAAFAPLLNEIEDRLLVAEGEAT